MLYVIVLPEILFHLWY